MRPGSRLWRVAETSVNESGTTDTFTVVLDAEPTSDVVLTVVSGDTGEATISPASLTFTAINWNATQTVTVTGVNDALIDGNQVTTITLSVDDANSDDTFDPLADQTVSATTVDDDAAGFTIVESGGTSVNESGTTDTFTVVLDAEPTSDVVLTVVSGDTGEATVSPASLTFTALNWNATQTVTVTGVDDALDDGNQLTTITLSVDDANSDNAFDPLADQTVSATTVDDDAAGFTIVESGGTSVNESGTTDTFTVVLDAEPTSDVVLTVVSGDTGEATVSPVSLTFTAINWSATQTVTVTGVNDALDDGNQLTTITLSVDDANSDNAFDPLADQTVSATTVDDDAAGFTIVEAGGSTSVNESGTTDTFTVVLDAEPTSDVVLTVVSGDTGEATVSPSPLTFTNANWNSAQTVTVTGVDDALIDGNQLTTITLSVDDANSDNGFDPLADQTVSATTADDEVAGFTIEESGGSTSVNESGTTDTFTVVLNAKPVTNVELTVTNGDTGEATALPTPLVFTNANWNTAQTVTVTGVDDALGDGNQNTTITISVDDANSDDAYDPLSDQTVSATTVDDDDATGFTIEESDGSTLVNESGTIDTFSVVLDVQPGSDVILVVASGDTGEATVSAASLVFTSGNWATPQAVTVKGVDDALDDGYQFTTITLSVDDANSDNAFDPLADQIVTAITATDAPNVEAFTVPDLGGTSMSTNGGPGEMEIGYAQIRSEGGMTTPSGIAIFGFTQNGVLISEAGVPAAALVQEGRIFAEVNGPVNTGLAIANPNNDTVTIWFVFTDVNGVDYGADNFTIGPMEQTAHFLDQAPFNGIAPMLGTFTFFSNQPISVIALRGFTNERSEFLMTTLPVSPLTARGSDTVYFPHFADGAGWTTQIILVNPTNTMIGGRVRFFGTGSETAAALPATITLTDAQVGSDFTYTIAPRSSTRLQTANLGGSTQVGSVRVIPDSGTSAPSGVGVFSFQNGGGVTVSEAGVPASAAGEAFRVYIEASGTAGQPGSIRSGLALTNTSEAATVVLLELTNLDGTVTGLTESITIPASGQVAKFIDEIFLSLTTPFSGILRVTSTATDMAVVGLRLTTNERSDFLITTTPPSDETSATTSADLFFPHFVDSGGWTTQFILFSGTAAQTTLGTLSFIDQTGQALDLSVN